MTYDRSCGAVVFTKIDGVIQYVLVQESEGFWSFPKGRMEIGETEEETALREISEEVYLKVNILPGFRTIDEHAYPNRPDLIKQIVYFCAEYKDQEIIAQDDELLGVCLVPYEEAIRLFKYESSKRILKEVNDFLTNK